ncbi:hypothetical protein ACU635_22675 [[Actinomadura] parvosata]
MRSSAPSWRTTVTSGSGRWTSSRTIVMRQHTSGSGGAAAAGAR